MLLETPELLYTLGLVKLTVLINRNNYLKQNYENSWILLNSFSPTYMEPCIFAPTPTKKLFLFSPNQGSISVFKCRLCLNCLLSNFIEILCFSHFHWWHYLISIHTLKGIGSPISIGEGTVDKSPRIFMLCFDGYLIQ